MVHTDKGPKLRSILIKNIYQAIGVSVRFGAVNYTQSQGLAERFNETLLATSRKKCMSR